MQIVIDIDDNLYTRLFDNGEEYAADMRRACGAIRKGTPLPKGHGRLIDVDELYNSLEFPTQQFASAFKQVLDDAPTIIEADKASDEGMTLDEARLTLKELRYYPSLDDFDVVAINVAIKAIEAMQHIKGVNTVKLRDDALTILSICDILEGAKK